VWFKRHESGKNGKEGGRWASEGLGITVGAGGLVSARVPRRLRNGVYLVRHEM
jgi:Auxiliary Activity family 9 (formerly GH61)